MLISYPANVKKIIDRLQEEGYEAYAVGGCVRDSYLGLTPNDWDITTNAKPDQIKELFRRTIDIGIEHGTVKVMIGNDGYEITTYRIDGEYEDSRHPKQVTFTDELKEDLRRRDFTINAMAYSEKTGLVDLFGGVDDLESGIIRAVGDPEERFSEDALRILRALRFSARFGYNIDKKTKEAIVKLAPTLANISAERIREEMEKLICSDNPDRLRWAYIYGVTKIIFPEWDVMMECYQQTPHHFTDVGDHTVMALEYIVDHYADIPETDNRVLRIATVLHDIAKPVMKTFGPDRVNHFTGHPGKGVKPSEAFLRRLKYDNDTIARVKKLVRYHDDLPELSYPEVRRFIVSVEESNMENLIRLKYADLYAHTKYHINLFEDKVKTLEKMYRKILNDGDCLSIKDLAVNGHDLINEGIKEGPQLGEVLGRLFDIVLDDPAMNDRDRLLEELHRISG